MVDQSAVFQNGGRLGQLILERRCQRFLKRLGRVVQSDLFIAAVPEGRTAAISAIC